MARKLVILLALAATLGATATGCHRKHALCEDTAGYRGAECCDVPPRR